MVNMGELFAHPRLCNVPMERVPLSQPETERFLLEEGDLLFARQSLVLEGAGKCSIFLRDDEPVTFESHLIRVRLDQAKAHPTYYFYYFRSHHGRSAIRSIVEQGAGASGIRGHDLAALEVQWRPLRQQRAIAHVLGTLDDKIDLNRRMNETLEEMARALFKSWFVDFDPVRAKMEGRWRRGESLPGLPADLYDLFPNRLVPSELGDIPEGWEVKALGELFVAKNVRLGNVDAPEYSCTNEGLVPRSERFKKKLSMSNSKNRVISKGDFVFGLSRRVLNFGLMCDDIGCVSPAYRTYSTNQDFVIPDLLERIMRLQTEYFYLAVSASSREGQSISQDALYDKPQSYSASHCYSAVPISNN